MPKDGISRQFLEYTAGSGESEGCCRPTAAAKDIMADYIGQVTDQTGKSFTRAQADILIRWAKIVI